MGILYARVNFQVATSLIFVMASLFTLLVPFAMTLTFLLALFVVNGVCLGFFEAGASVFMIHLWGKEAANFIQVLQLMYGVGSLIAPLMAQPFLTTAPEHLITLSNTTDTQQHDTALQLIYPYSILAGFMAFNAIFSLVIWIFYPDTPTHPSRKLAEGSTEEVDEQPEEMIETKSDMAVQIEIPSKSETDIEHYGVWKILTIVLAIIFMHVYFGLQVSFGSYLMTYAVNCDLKLSKTTGALLTTLYWTTFTVTKVGAIFFVNCLGHEVSILLSLGLMMIAGSFLLPLANHDATSLLAGVALEGIGVSSIFGCMFGHMEDYFQVTDTIASLMAMSSVLGELSFPLLISHFIEADPQILMTVTLICACFLTVIFASMMIICKTKLTIKSL